MRQLLLVLALMVISNSSFASAPIETFDQRINPKSRTDLRTFKQRFMIDSQFATDTGSPVLYYICGESNCFDDSSETFPALVRYEARVLHAHMVVLEHRYFGRSQPFSSLTRQNLRFLSVENALTDLANFEKWMIQSRKLNGKWLAIGGSYAGILAAYYRSKFPNLVGGALASSAPVRVKSILQSSDEHDRKVLGEACYTSVDTALKKMLADSKDPEFSKNLKKSFGVPLDAETENFFGYLMYHIEFYIQYGLATSFCEQVASTSALQALTLFVTFEARNIKSMTYESLLQTIDRSNLDPAFYYKISGGRAWNYLQCTELGFFGSKSSSENCTTLFGTIGFNKLWRMNRDYYAGLLSPKTSRIIFTNGDQDPWSRYSISEELNNATNPNTQTFMIAGKAHGSDLNINDDHDPVFNDAFNAITTSFREWVN